MPWLRRNLCEIFAKCKNFARRHHCPITPACRGGVGCGYMFAALIQDPIPVFASQCGGPQGWSLMWGSDTNRLQNFARVIILGSPKLKSWICFWFGSAWMNDPSRAYVHAYCAVKWFASTELIVIDNCEAYGIWTANRTLCIIIIIFFLIHSGIPFYQPICYETGRRRRSRKLPTLTAKRGIVSFWQINFWTIPGRGGGAWMRF